MLDSQGNLLELGDEVTLIASVGNSHLSLGDAGIVVVTGTNIIGVDWKKYVDGHDCDGKCKNGNGWFISLKSVVKRTVSWKKRMKGRIS